MTRIGIPRIISIGAALVAVIILSLVLGRMDPLRRVSDMTGRMFAPLSGALHGLGNFFGTLVNGGDLATENIQLRRQVQQSHADTAQIDQLQRDNVFLRASLGLRAQLPHDLIEGAVFSYNREGGVRQVVLNRGLADGVIKGDAVITDHGALVGVVEEVFDHHAIVRSLGDPTLESAARIVGSEVTGLVHTDPSQGLILDLVQKSETVTEGQTVATSGNDQFPAGIVIGTVKSVDSDSATLFKIVRLTPVIQEDFDGQVLITRP